MSPVSLVFLDECGVCTGMTRLYGRATGQNRVIDHVPLNHMTRTTVLSAIRFSGVTAPVTIKGSLNGSLFREYVENYLAPSLKPGDVVVMDNLSSHKVKGIKEAIEEAGATILYIPPYSPDLNSIEELWSKVKAYLRKKKAQTKNELYEALYYILHHIPLNNILDLFSNLAGDVQN
jgi:transposase